MAENSSIEWTDHTFNPWTGCTKVSLACDHCYAEGWAKRSGQVEWGPHGARQRTTNANWRLPRKWNAALAGTGRRERVFCASLADVFDNHRTIDQTWRLDLWRLIEETPHLDWLLLTKRPQNVKKMVPPLWMKNRFPPNVWVGTTVENQTEAERRVPVLLKIPARVRFLSCEPLLGQLDLLCMGSNGCFDALNGFDAKGAGKIFVGLQWVITGGESGPNSRPTNPKWFRDLRNQCAAASVPFLFKQWGDWVQDTAPEAKGAREAGKQSHQFEDSTCSWRVGKKKAGRTLDGVVHDGFPRLEEE